MSYSSYLETLRNEIPVIDDDFCDDEIMTYPEFLKRAKIESDLKDDKAKKFYMTNRFKDKDGRLFFLDFDDILKSKASLMQNFTSSFARKKEDDSTVMAWKTATLPPKYRLSNNPEVPYKEVIKNQHKRFEKCNNHIRYDKNNRNIDYFRVNELHKSGDLHQHTMDFIPNTKDDILNYIKVQIRAKKSKNMGRTEIRLQPEYKDFIVKEYNLIRRGKEYFFNLKDAKKGSCLFFTFFDPNRNKRKDIVAYMMKYTSKSVAFSGNKSDEYYVFRELGIRAFTYSHGVLPPLTAYQKVRSDLIMKDKKYADLYELQKDIDLGVLSFESFYEKVEPEYYERSREKISNIDRSRGYPIIYTEKELLKYCISEEYTKLVSVKVTFADNSTPIVWETGKCERIPVSREDYDWVVQHFK